MAYLSIDNLYKAQTILLFKECYALEKIHGTSAHITYRENQLTFFSGGSSHENFVKLFDRDKLLEKFIQIGQTDIVVYGEAHGGKMQGMRETYGNELKFVAFEVKIGG